jgi:CheY-like chemotaxis protein
VLVDPLMIGSGGLDVVSALQRSPGTRDIPVIMCTLKEVATAELRHQLASIPSPGRPEGGDGDAGLIQAIADARAVSRTPERA